MSGNKPSTPKKIKVRRLQVSFKEREYFTENLALLLKAAVPVGQALQSLRETARTRRMRSALDEMQKDIEAGISLADSLTRSGIVSGQTLALVRLGEQSGHLVENMQLAAQQEEKRHFFRARVRSALIYPAFVMSMTVIVGLGVSWFLLPRLSDTFAQLNVDLPFISRVMIGMGNFLKEHGLMVVPAGVFAFLFIGYILFAAPRTKFIGERILFLIPGISPLLRQVEVAQFGYLLGTLLEAGLPVTQAVNLLSSASSSRQYQKFYGFLAKSLEDGQSFQQSLREYKGASKLLPPSVQQMIIAGEHSGSLSQVLTTVGRTYEQKSDVTTQNLEAVIEPVLLVIVWVGVMAVAVAIIVPIYGLLGGLE
jgi:type II secretory pathway component PulF